MSPSAPRRAPRRNYGSAAGGTAPSAPMGSVGASFAVYGRTMADAQWTFGSEDGNRGWGAGLRFVF